MLGLPTGRWFDVLIGKPLGRFATAVVRWGLGARRLSADRQPDRYPGNPGQRQGQGVAVEGDV